MKKFHKTKKPSTVVTFNFMIWYIIYLFIFYSYISIYLYSQECAHRFPVQLYGNNTPNKQDKFVFSVAPDQVKCVATLTGDSITNAVSVLWL